MNRLKVIRDMTSLMILHGLHKQAPLVKVMSWCAWAVNSGHVEYVYDGDEMIGFMDWVRSDSVPSDYYYQDLIDRGVDSGNVAIALNCVVVRGKDTLRKLIKSARAKTQGCQTLVWHNRKKGTMVYHKGGELCNATAVC